MSATGVTAVQLLDRHLIDDVFPDKPGKAVPGRRRLRASLRRVGNTANSDVAGISRCDIPTVDGAMVARYWSPVNSAITDDRGTVRFIVHRVQDVTAARNLLTALASSTAPDRATGQHGTDGELARYTDEIAQSPDLAAEFRDQIEFLRHVVDARAIIEQAKGMLMAEHCISADRAFEILRAESQRCNAKLRDVAAHHVLLRSVKFSTRTWS